MTNHGVIAVRCYKRRPEEERWSLNRMSGVKGSSWEPAPGTGRTEFKSRIGIKEGEDGRKLEETGVREPNPREIRTTKGDVDKCKTTP